MNAAESLGDQLIGYFKGEQEHDRPAAESGITRQLVTVSMDTVAAKRIVPLWPGVLYAGKVTVVAGVPGDGKSLLSLDVAARLSAGSEWPCGNGRFTQGRVLLLTAEDDAADTIRPRLDVAGAVCRSVELVTGVSKIEDNGQRVLDPVSLVMDLPHIEQKLMELAAVLLIVDPLTSFAGSDTNKTADMRELLDNLSQMAARTGVAVLVITHLNKRSDARKALQLVAGSHVITAAVRVALVTARDPNDQPRRLLLPIKLNIDRDAGGFAFRIEAERHAVGEIPRVEWERERVTDLTADEALIDSTPRAQAAVEKSVEVQDWARELLRSGPVAAKSVWKQAGERGFSERRVRNAMRAIKAVCELMGYQGEWHWRLPSVSDGNGRDAGV